MNTTNTTSTIRKTSSTTKTNNNNKIKTNMPHSGNGEKPDKIELTVIDIELNLWNNLRKLRTNNETISNVIQRMFEFYVKENNIKGVE